MRACSGVTQGWACTGTRVVPRTSALLFSFGDPLQQQCGRVVPVLPVLCVDSALAGSACLTSLPCPAATRQVQQENASQGRKRDPEQHSLVGGTHVAGGAAPACCNRCMRLLVLLLPPVLSCTSAAVFASRSFPLCCAAAAACAVSQELRSSPTLSPPRCAPAVADSERGGPYLPKLPVIIMLPDNKSLSFGWQLEHAACDSPTAVGSASSSGASSSSLGGLDDEKRRPQAPAGASGQADGAGVNAAAPGAAAAAGEVQQPGSATAAAAAAPGSYRRECRPVGLGRWSGGGGGGEWGQLTCESCWLTQDS